MKKLLNLFLILTVLEIIWVILVYCRQENEENKKLSEIIELINNLREKNKSDDDLIIRFKERIEELENLNKFK